MVLNVAARARLARTTGRRLWASAIERVAFHDWDEGAVLMVFGVVIGGAVGLGVVGFYKLVDLAYLAFATVPAQRLGVLENAFYRPLLTAAGLWVAWALVRRLPPARGAERTRRAARGREARCRDPRATGGDPDARRGGDARVRRFCRQRGPGGGDRRRPRLGARAHLPLPDAQPEDPRRLRRRRRHFGCVQRTLRRRLLRTRGGARHLLRRRVQPRGDRERGRRLSPRAHSSAARAWCACRPMRACSRGRSCCSTRCSASPAAPSPRSTRASISAPPTRSAPCPARTGCVRWWAACSSARSC